MKSRYFLLLFFAAISAGFGQVSNSASPQRVYKPSEVIDPSYGINRYDKLNYTLGGDSVRKDKKGYACQGWIEDSYVSGHPLHKGYYVDGKLKIFKNFYDNGQVERSYKINDLKRSTMQIFYPDGKLKSNIEYLGTNAQKEEDFYPNGQTEFIEEYHKSMVYLIQRKSFFENGKPASMLELTDQRKKIYNQKEYYENGSIKEEGQLIFNDKVGDYQKNGKWKTYDEMGKSLADENYIDGQIN